MTDHEQDLKINTLENNQNSMAEKIDDLKKTVVAGFSELKAEFKAVRDESDKKYASKLTEHIVYTLAGLFLIAMIGALINLVIK